MTEAQVSISLRLLGLTAASWVMSVLQMSGMQMGTATNLGSFPHFFPIWVTMMAAMMLPGTAAPLLGRSETQATQLTQSAPSFVLSYLGVWAATGLLAYGTYRPHGSVAAGAVVIGAGLYETTPVKRRCRRRCQASGESGLNFGLSCLGSTVGLMAVLLAISPMNLVWMASIAVLAVTEKCVPRAWPIEPVLAVALLVCGTWILLAPASVPGLVPAM